MADIFEDDDAIPEFMHAMKDSQGVGVVTVSDGTVMVFSAKTLKGLLERAEASEDGTATVFIKHVTKKDLA